MTLQMMHPLLYGQVGCIGNGMDFAVRSIELQPLIVQQPLQRAS